LRPRGGGLRDKFVPDASRQIAAGNASRGPVVVVADPHSHDDVVGESDEPCVLVILARPRLALDRAVDPRRATCALANHAGENIVNCRARCWIACRLELRFLPREQSSIAVANGTDGVRLDASASAAIAANARVISNRVTSPAPSARLGTAGRSDCTPSLCAV